MEYIEVALWLNELGSVSERFCFYFEVAFER